MLTLPDAMLPVLSPFATLFQTRTWIKAQLLLVGAILAPGQRTVASALRVMGRSDDCNYARYHHVLNRAVWSPLQVSQVLLTLLIQHLDQGDGPLVFGIRAFCQIGKPWSDAAVLKSKPGASTAMRCVPAAAIWSRSAACAGFT